MATPGSPSKEGLAISFSSIADSMEIMSSLWLWMSLSFLGTKFSSTALLPSLVEGSCNSLLYQAFSCTQRMHTRYGLGHPHCTTATLITHLLIDLYPPMPLCFLL